MNKNINNNSPAYKRVRKNSSRRVHFKNNVNSKNLNMEENAQSSRKPIEINKGNRNNLPTYMTNRNVLMQKINRVNTHKKRILNDTKNRNTL